MVTDGRTTHPKLHKSACLLAYLPSTRRASGAMYKTVPRTLTSLSSPSKAVINNSLCQPALLSIKCNLPTASEINNLRRRQFRARLHPPALLLDDIFGQPVRPGRRQVLVPPPSFRSSLANAREAEGTVVLIFPDDMRSLVPFERGSQGLRGERIRSERPGYICWAYIWDSIYRQTLVQDKFRMDATYLRGRYSASGARARHAPRPLYMRQSTSYPLQEVFSYSH